MCIETRHGLSIFRTIYEIIIMVALFCIDINVIIDNVPVIPVDEKNKLIFFNYLLNDLLLYNQINNIIIEFLTKKKNSPKLSTYINQALKCKIICVTLSCHLFAVSCK